MWPFRRRREETLNEQLLREAGLADEQEERQAEPPDGLLDEHRGEPAEATLAPAGDDMPAQDEDDPEGDPDDDDDEPQLEVETVLIEVRPDAVLTAEAPDISAATVDFVALPDGELLAEDDETADEDLSALADAVENRLQPPYRVHARRTSGDEWELLAYLLDVRTIAYAAADTLQLVHRDGVEELLADGVPVDGSIPQLEAAGAALGGDFAVRAERLDGDFWEIRAAAL
jgi:hypothetical protein